MNGIFRETIEIKCVQLSERLGGAEIHLSYLPQLGYVLYKDAPDGRGGQEWLWSIWEGRKSLSEINQYLDGMLNALEIVKDRLLIEGRVKA